MPKQRLTITVDAALVAAAEAAVASGAVTSVSAWVNGALVDRAAHEKRMRALGEAIAEYESEYGKITEREMQLAEREARCRAEEARGEARSTRPSQKSA